MAEKRTADRKSSLLSNERAKRWYDSSATGSRLTADVMARGLSRLLDSLQTDPERVVDLARRRPGDLEGALSRYVLNERGHGAADSYISKTFSALKSYLRHEGVQFARFPKLKVIEGLSIREESVPSQDQLGRIFAALPLRWRAAAALMAQSGLRPGILCLHSGVPAPGPKDRRAAVLLVRHLPELEISGKKSTFSRLPFKIDVPAELSKTSRPYVTFGTSESARILLAYLNERMAGGEAFGPSSPLIAGKLAGAERDSQGRPVTTETLTYALRRAIRDVIPERTPRPYVFRAYASQMMLLAEQRTGGRITRDGREAMLGHDLGVSGLYNLSKKLSSEVVESLREQFAAAVPYLETTAQMVDNRVEAYRRMLDAAGVDRQEAARLAATASGDEVFARIKEALREASGEDQRQKLVPVSAVQPYLDEGWRVRTAVQDLLILDPPGARN
jgi:hypothetical protein